MLKIHHLLYSRSDRILWLAEELGLDYEVINHQRDPQTFRSPQSLWQVSPLGKAPVIQDGDLTIYESGAITEYVLERYGQDKLRPKADSPAYVPYLHWMHAAESTLMAPILMDVLTTLTQTKSEALTGFMSGEYKTVFDHVARTVSDHDYIAGPEFTAADIMVSYPLRMADGSALPATFQSGAPLDQYPQITAYIKRLKARPAYQRAEKKFVPA